MNKNTQITTIERKYQHGFGMVKPKDADATGCSYSFSTDEDGLMEFSNKKSAIAAAEKLSSAYGSKITITSPKGHKIFVVDSRSN